MIVNDSDDRRRILPEKRRRAPLGDILTLGFLIAVALMWVFADSINANPVSLVILSALAVLLMINMLSARKNRRAVEQKKREIDEMRESLGDIDNTDQRDKYYF